MRVYTGLKKYAQNFQLQAPAVWNAHLPSGCNSVCDRLVSCTTNTATFSIGALLRRLYPSAFIQDALIPSFAWKAHEGPSNGKAIYTTFTSRQLHFLKNQEMFESHVLVLIMPYLTTQYLRPSRPMDPLQSLPPVPQTLSLC